MTTMPDPLVVLERYLLSTPSVAALVGDRAFGFELPLDQADAMPRKCVVASEAGGRSLGPSARSNMLFGHVRVDMKQYGETPNEAKQVELAVAQAMKDLRRYGSAGEGGLFWATVEGGPSLLREPTVHWPFFLTIYQIRVAEVRNA